MDIHVIKGAWSILPFEWNDVPKFAILTGFNGVGKTQLLQVIHASITGTMSNSHGKAIPRVEIIGAVYQRTDVVLQSNWGAGLGVRGEDALKLTGELRELYNAVKQNRSNHVRVREIVEKVLNKPIEEADFEEFVAALPDEYTLYSERLALGYSSFSKAAALYRLKAIDLRFNGADEIQILKILGSPPWETINEVFNTARFPFRLTVPKNISVFSSFDSPKLIDQRSGAEVSPEQLSSGEKVILGLSLLIYRANFEEALPKLMLLDEPDSHLHPGMIKQLVDVISDVLVGRLGIQVLMTTHSPSTIAFAPEDSLYVMKGDTPRIRKVGRDEALRELTSGLLLVGPHLKYVLVEGEGDVEFFKMLTDVSQLLPGLELQAMAFIPVSKRDRSGGGETQVRAWVEKLQGAMDDRFVGIIDKDKGNHLAQGIGVLGRYSIENYLLDPLVLFSVLLEDGKAPAIVGEILQVGDENMFRNMPSDRLQRISDALFRKLDTATSEMDNDPITVRYANDIELKYPSWLINENGKMLMSRFQEEYYDSKTVNPSRLRKAYRRVRMIPLELIEVMQKL